jgi:hypothetical protein
MAGPRMRLSASVLGAPDPQTLGGLYARLPDGRWRIATPSG